MPIPATPLPEVPLGEWNAIDTRTAPGLFVFRHMQSFNLLQLPDYGGGDLNSEQRKDALRFAVSVHKPLAALALFLGVVALEDFIRDLGARLADSPSCLMLFPRMTALRAQPVNRAADKMFKRLDTDPAASLDPEDINKRFLAAINVEPFPVAEYWHFRDLVLIRHTVAHHGAVIRQVDVPRFAHFIVNHGRVINPPVEFVKAELTYLYKLGRQVKKNIRSAVFEKLIRAIGAGWAISPSQEVVDLIELFGYFGYLETSIADVSDTVPESDQWQSQEVEALRIQDLLIQRCIADLRAEFGG